jgi:hypothetical protein
MGVFGKLKKVVNVVTGGQVTLLEKQIELGGKPVDVLVDVKNQIVRIGDEIFRKVPGEVFFPGVGPLAGLLKNEVEDELIMLNPLGIVLVLPVDPVGGAIVIGDLIGLVQHRTMFNDELEIAKYVFRNSIPRMSDIRLTNLVSPWPLGGDPFAAPMHGGGATVHLGGAYNHTARIEDIPLLLHELTHIWQLERSILEEIQVCQGLFTGAKNKFVDQYSFNPGKQWSDYGTEQQASIVQAWALGAISRNNLIFDIGASNVFGINTPLFRYINGNVRRSDNNAKTGSGRSVRQLLADGDHRTMRDMHPEPPSPPWW